MNATISAEIANQRHLDLVAQVEARRAVTLARTARRAGRQSARQAGLVRPRRRPIAALTSWIAAGQL